MTKPAVLFDLDGTLLDTLDDLTNAVNYILRKYAYPERTKREVRSFLGNGALALIKCSLPEDVGEEILQDRLAEYVEYYNAHSRIETKPYEGVLSFLEELKGKGIAVAVVSNKPDRAVKELCREYFGDLVTFAVGDRADIARKPSADPVKYAMTAIGCDKAVYVGDSEVDVLTAQNAGMPCISMTWGFRDRDVLEECGAKYFADNADELKKYVYDLLSVEDAR